MLLLVLYIYIYTLSICCTSRSQALELVHIELNNSNLMSRQSMVQRSAPPKKSSVCLASSPKNTQDDKVPCTTSTFPRGSEGYQKSCKGWRQWPSRHAEELGVSKPSSNLIAMTSNLIAMASKIATIAFVSGNLFRKRVTF